MAKHASQHNTGIWAPLSNVLLAGSVMDRLRGRSANLPGIAALYGPSGYGKSMAAAYCANKHAGAYVECRSFFTKRTFMDAITKELGLRPGRTVGESFEQIVAELQLSQQPLIIDEVDYIVDTKIIEIIRDIHEAARCSILLIGEELLPRKLQRAERFHNRVLIWQPAMPATLDDTRRLAQFYCPVPIADDWIKHVHAGTRAIVRRICVNIDRAREEAQKEGAKQIDMAWWGDRDLYTGDAPVRRMS